MKTCFVACKDQNITFIVILTAGSTIPFYLFLNRVLKTLNYQSTRTTRFKTSTKCNKETKTAISTCNNILFKSANHNHITLLIIYPLVCLPTFFSIPKFLHLYSRITCYCTTHKFSLEEYFPSYWSFIV